MNFCFHYYTNSVCPSIFVFKSTSSILSSNSNPFFTKNAFFSFCCTIWFLTMSLYCMLRCSRMMASIILTKSNACFSFPFFYASILYLRNSCFFRSAIGIWTNLFINIKFLWNLIGSLVWSIIGPSLFNMLRIYLNCSLLCIF